MPPLVVWKETFDLFCAECLVTEVGAEVSNLDVLICYKDWRRYNPGKKVMSKLTLYAMMDEKYEKVGNNHYKGVRLGDYDPAAPAAAPAPATAPPPLPPVIPLPSVVPVRDLSTAPEQSKIPYTICDLTCDALRDMIHDKMRRMPVDTAGKFVYDLKFWITYYESMSRMSTTRL